MVLTIFKEFLNVFSWKTKMDEEENEIQKQKKQIRISVKSCLYVRYGVCFQILCGATVMCYSCDI